jgi:coenzyme F420-reducing hydrogenase delta subunit
VGACDSAGILLGGQHAGVLTGAVTSRLVEARRTAGPPPVLVYACRLMPDLEGRLDTDGRLRDVPRALVMGLPCVGMLHPDMIESALAAGAAGVYIAGCLPEDCQAREGSDLLAQRLTGARQPRLKVVAPGTVRLAWYSPVEVRRFERELRAFAETLP